MPKIEVPGKSVFIRTRIANHPPARHSKEGFEGVRATTQNSIVYPSFSTNHIDAAVGEAGYGWYPDDVELYVSTSDGGGKWSTPIVATSESAQAAFANHETGAGSVARSDKHAPAFADLADLGKGQLGLLMVDKTTSIIGVTNNSATISGRAVAAMSSFRTAAPWVVFRKL